jgi:hypothetical protein
MDVIMTAVVLVHALGARDDLSELARLQGEPGRGAAL